MNDEVSEPTEPTEAMKAFSQQLDIELKALRQMPREEFLNLYTQKREEYLKAIEEAGSVSKVSVEKWASWGNIAAAAAYHGIKPGGE